VPEHVSWWQWVAVALIGALAGALANRAADVLPGVGRPELPVGRPEYRRRGRPTVLLAAMIAAFLLGWARFAGNGLALVAFWFYAFYFLTVSAIDLEHRRVLDIMSAPAAAAALVLAGFRGWSAVGQALAGGAVGLGVFLVLALFSRGKLGAGDVKLAGVIGLATGYPAVAPALFLGVFVGGAATGILLLSGRIGLKSYVAYAPYLSAGALAVLFFVLGS